VHGVDRFLTPEDEIPSFDFYCHLLSLPRVFGTSLTTIPADVPYIEAKAQWVERWAGRVSGRGGLKVGLVWAGNPSHTNDANRSLNLLQLLPLLGVKGVTFFALQKGARSEQAVEYAGDNWVNLGPEINDFTDTAGIIEGLDLVICVDTSVAHLAGAMAKPVWLLLPKPSDFRWMEDREDSPWYPTMRLFRQKARGDWKGVIERLTVALEQQAKEGAPAPWTRKPSAPLQVAYPTQWIAGVTKLPGHRPGLSAVAETRMGMVQYLPDEPVVGDAIAWYGEYLQALVDFLSTQVAAGSTVMEVEAGIGLHALALSRMVGPQGHVMLYESDAVKKQILEQNLEVHGVRNATLMRRRIGGVPEAEPVAGEPDGVPQHETLDDLQVERLDWLKVNGGRRALEVLAGGEETIWRLRPRLLVATTGVENDEALVAELQQRLQNLGYQCHFHASALYVASNFNRRQDDMFAGSGVPMILAIPEEAFDDPAARAWTQAA
jgi:precorrin-6B methylase 2